MRLTYGSSKVLELSLRSLILWLCNGMCFEKRWKGGLKASKEARKENSKHSCYYNGADSGQGIPLFEFSA